LTYQKTCEQCERPFASRRPDAETCSEECKYQRWIERQVLAASQPVTEHPLQQVRDERATKKHNRDLGGLIKQAIVDQIKTAGECHADDLIPLYPEGEVALCRRLATAQFGSLAKLKLIFKDGWRRTETASRKGGGGWIWKFTDKGRAHFMPSLVGFSDDNKGGGDAIDNASPTSGNAGTSPPGAPVGVAESGESGPYQAVSVDPGQAKGKSDHGRPVDPSSAAEVDPPETLFGESALDRMADAA
jgi:hypothetical protein